MLGETAQQSCTKRAPNFSQQAARVRNTDQLAGLEATTQTFETVREILLTCSSNPPWRTYATENNNKVIEEADFDAIT